MRKQVQKERCTKIMLTKCKAVCHLYDKVQLAAAKMLDADLHQTSLLACRYRCHIQQRTAAGTISCNIYYAAKKAASRTRAGLSAGIRFIATRYFRFQF